MSSIIDGEYRSKAAGEDLTSAQYRLVTLESDNALDLADAITDKTYGVLQNAPDTGQEGSVKATGHSKVVAKEALAIGDFVGPATDGKAQVAVATQFSRGICVKAAGAENDLAEIELFYTSDDVGGAETFSALTITGIIAFSTGLVTLSDAVNIVLNATTGTKIGTGTTQKIGFWNATPAGQPTHNADPTAMVTQTAVNPDAVTCVTMGDLVATEGTGWGASSEANFDKITAAVDQAIVDILTIRTQLVATVADVDAAETATLANKAAIDAINADDATTGMTALS